MSYRCIVVDPPWKSSDKLGKRGAAARYPTMSTQEICELPIMRDAAWIDPVHSVLLLWRLSSMQQDAIDVMRAWGYRLHSEIVWVKQTRSAEPKLHFGMGRIVRGAHETCLIGVRKRYAVLSHSERSVVHAPVGEHSEKPQAFYDLVERLLPGPRLELFARQLRPGWHCMGNALKRSA